MKHFSTVHLTTYHLHKTGCYLHITSNYACFTSSSVSRILCKDLFLSVSLAAKDRKPLFSGFVETGMVEELRTLALYIKELQLRDKFGGILDLKKILFEKKKSNNIK